MALLLARASIPVRTVLELGSGGGSNAFHLKTHFTMTLLDLSQDMLEVSRRLNPECEHQRGDMRTARLGRSFDAVFVHDAIDYMTTETDLRQAIETAHTHCRPGGVALFIPDTIAEAFVPGTDFGGTDDTDGRGARYLEWTWDPNPSDTSYATEYAFLLRDSDGSVRVAHETHHLGVFGRDVWVRLLSAAGFEPEVGREVTTEDRTPRTWFLGRRGN